jgi:glycosyltransferase involved in cell wall biosynthesis
VVAPRVVVAHNFYRSDQPSGENSVVRDEIAGLQRRGLVVHPFFRSSDGLVRDEARGTLALARNALSPLANFSACEDLRALIRAERPDVVHFHNVFPLISPAAIRVCAREGVASVQTVHNYRRECARGTFYRDGGQCRLCEGRRLPSPAITHSCYRDSALQSVPMASSIGAHRSTWRRLDHHIVLTSFQRTWLERTGVPQERITVRPTAAKDVSKVGSPSAGRLCFVGRLEEQKGIDLLIRAWRGSTLPRKGWVLDIVGEGPLRADVETLCGSDRSIVLHGALGPAEVGEVMTRAAATVVPSRCLESYPRVISESFARGRPVVVVANANLASIVGDSGWIAGSTDALGGTLDNLSDEGELVARGARARAKFETELEEERSLDDLLSIYDRALRGRR